MSIATVSPEKYRLQDFACVEMMLRFAFVGNASFTVESGIEDGDLRVGSGDDAIHYEIQVKGSDEPVTSARLGEWLLHSPRNASVDTALERLMADPRRFFVLVASGRCTDELVPLRFAEDWLGQAHEGVLRVTANAVMDAFAIAEPEGTAGLDLHAARLANRDEVRAGLKVMRVMDALRRLVILDEVTRPGLERRIRDHLITRGMPLDRVGEAGFALLSVVDAARGDGGDALIRLDAKVGEWLPKTIAPSHYVGRGDEAVLTRELSLSSRLLLSGVGRSGKSTTARHLGARFESQGFAVGWFTSVASAAAFLEDPASGARLAVLDDPLGDDRQPPEGILARLGRLVATARTERRLIVAQGQEPLLEAAGATRLDGISSGGARWHDLSRPDPAFLVGFWRDAAVRNGFPAELTEQVAARLGDGDGDAPGVGALDLLSRSGDQLSAVEEVDAALRLAARDASGTGRTLRSRMMSPSTATALVLASTDVEPVAASELAFIQGEGGGRLPSYAEFTGRSSTLGVTSIPHRPLPDYETPPATNAATRADLGLFTRLHVVEVDRASAIRLSHGYYRQALSTTAPTSPFELEGLLAMHRRALFSRSAATARAAARNLDMLLDIVGSTDEARRLVFEQASEGLRSYFLATRDICFAFLLRHAREAVSLVEAASVNDWVQKVTFVRLDELQWHGDDAIHPIDGEVAFWPGGFRGPRSAVAGTLRTLAGDGAPPTPKDAAAALAWFDRYPAMLSAFQTERLLSYQEGIIRAEAARIWLSRPREADDALLDRMVRDDHPLMVIGSLRGMREGLRNCGADRRSRLADVVVGMASRTAGALAVMDDLVIFERFNHASERRRRDMAADWTLFARLLPTTLRHLPAHTSFDVAKFLNVLYESVPFVPPRVLVRICVEWLAWLGRMAGEGRAPGDFESGMLPLLIKATRGEPLLRDGLLARALSTPQTGLLLRFIADAVDAWGDLSDPERDDLLAALDGRGVDARWRRAVALTRRSVPIEVQRASLPVGASLADPAHDLRMSVPEPLLRACLSVHCGNPADLAGVSTLDRSGVWEAVVGLVAVEPGSPMIEIVLPHLCRDVEDGLLATAVREGVSRVPDVVFLRLMAESGNPHQAALAPGWRALFAAAPDAATRARWYDEVAGAAARLFDDVADIDALLTDPNDAKAVKQRLRADFTLAFLVVNHERAGSPVDRWPALLAEFETALDAASPAVFRFFDGYTDLLRSQGDLPAALQEKLKASRARIFEDRMAIWRRYRIFEGVHDWRR